MNLEDYEFMAKHIVYEVYDGIVWRHGLKTNIKFLGACQPEKVNNAYKEYIQRGKSISQIKVDQDSSGNDILELFFSERLELGDLEKEIEVGSCIVGVPSDGKYVTWISPKITWVG